MCMECIAGPITSGNVIYLPTIAQKRQVRTKLYWTKKITPDDNSNPQEQMITKKVYITKTINTGSGGGGLLEYGWQGNNMGVIIYSFNFNISPKMSYGVLECDIVMLQN